MYKNVIVIVWSVLLLCVIGILDYKLTKTKAQLTRVETLAQVDRAIAADDRDRAKTAITNQNSVVSTFKLNKDAYENNLTLAERDAMATKTKNQIAITKELAKNDSPTNQYKLMTNILQEFSHAAN